MPIRLVVLFALMLMISSSHAQDRDAPAEVMEAYTQAADECRYAGGEARPLDSFAVVKDLDGNWVADWILFYDGFCDGLPDYFCAADGCLLQIFMGEIVNRWTLDIEDVVRGFRMIEIGGQPAIELSLHASVCSYSGDEECVELVLFEDDEEAYEPSWQRPLTRLPVPRPGAAPVH